MKHRKCPHEPWKPEAAGCLVTGCRGGGDCGSASKHPDVDHRAALRATVQGTAQIRVSDCLDACEHSNVVIVTPSPTQRRHGARPVWLGESLTRHRH